MCESALKPSSGEPGGGVTPQRLTILGSYRGTWRLGVTTTLSLSLDVAAQPGLHPCQEAHLAVPKEREGRSYPFPYP